MVGFQMEQVTPRFLFYTMVNAPKYPLLFQRIYFSPALALAGKGKAISCGRLRQTALTDGPKMKPNPNAPDAEHRVIIPARDEGRNPCPPLWSICDLEFSLNHVPHEIVVVDDGSQDQTWGRAAKIEAKNYPTMNPIQNTGEHGFGRAITFWPCSTLWRRCGWSP